MVKSMRQDKAEINLSVARCDNLLRKGLPEKHVSGRAPVYLAGAIESMVLSLLNRAADNAQDTETAGHIPTKRVYPNDLIKAVRHDPDFSRAFSGFSFSSLAPANKPINFILPADEAKERRDRINLAKEEAKKTKGKSGIEKKKKDKASKKNKENKEK
jgi:histone H3/H4